MINGMRLHSFDARTKMAVLLLFLTAPAWAQEAIFEGHPAISLGNDKLELLVLKQGASVASVILRDDPAKLNPLWEPARMVSETGGRSSFNPGTGQFLCVDGFGGVSP